MAIAAFKYVPQPAAMTFALIFLLWYSYIYILRWADFYQISWNKKKYVWVYAKLKSKTVLLISPHPCRKSKIVHHIVLTFSLYGRVFFRWRVSAENSHNGHLWNCRCTQREHHTCMSFYTFSIFLGGGGRLILGVDLYLTFLAHLTIRCIRVILTFCWKFSKSVKNFEW